MIPAASAIASLLERYRDRARIYAEDGQTAPAALCERFVAEMERALNGTKLTLPPAPAAGTSDALASTWRERLWTCPAETRLGVVELCEALNRPKSWVYRHTSLRSGLVLLPHRKFDGELVFVAGEIRRWLDENEEVVKSIVADSGPVVRSIGEGRAVTRRAS